MSARREPKRVYSFGGGKAEGRADMKELLGGKGANLAEMTRLGLPVPPGFTLSTAVCAETNRSGGVLPAGLFPQVKTALARVERAVERRFGDPEAPLLVSVRSGARASMPGMMDTVLNLGLNAETVEGLAAGAGERFALDSYRRFVQMYGEVVLGVPADAFEHRLEVMKARRGTALDTELESEDLRALVDEFRQIVVEETDDEFPEDPEDQLWGAVRAVFRSWENKRAVRYRQLHGVPDSWGTAVNVQAMVFGNMGEDCATGVAFSRDPSTGENVFYGEYLVNAQGEDVVAGIRTPLPLNRRAQETGAAPKSAVGGATLEEEMPKAYRQLLRIRRTLERHYRDMQDIEFTIQQGKLWMLQTRSGKRTIAAAVKIAVDMARERLITREEALLRVDAGFLDQLLHPTLDPNATRTVIAKGLPASPGAACGTIALTADEAEARAKAGEKVLLVRVETSPEDIHGMHAAEGVLTARGGMTSHAAVVARGMGKCCVAGCTALRIFPERGEVEFGTTRLRVGDELTLDGGRGEVILGRVPMVHPELGVEFDHLMRWADRERQLEVRANADTPTDAATARRFGARGIGLCRTEHMFFEEDRIRAVREMILADHEEARLAALAQILPMQRDDFEAIFREMAGQPVTIRLLDPPLHEFLPQDEAGVRELATQVGAEVAPVRARVEALREFNPMLGHRGCRLGISFPEIYEMQTRAISEAACRVAGEGIAVKPEIMIPLVAHPNELRVLRERAERTIAEVLRAYSRRLRIQIGTMIEVPRAALTAAEVAIHADFFSFGTNDMTQMAFGLSRDDAGKFLPHYLESGILDDDPFVSIDRAGIGALVRLGVEGGRSAKPDLKIGVCGEHGGDAKSVAFFHDAGLDYVSCSPFRVPAARLAAAQAAISERATKASRRSHSSRTTVRAKKAAKPRGRSAKTRSRAKATRSKGRKQ